MSSINSVLTNMITQYTKQFIDKINELENENQLFKQKIHSYSSVSKTDFDKLTEYNDKLETFYIETKKENINLKQQLITQQNMIQIDISNIFKNIFDKTNYQNKQKIYSLPPNQKQLHRNAKKTARKFLNTSYKTLQPIKLKFGLGQNLNNAFIHDNTSQYNLNFLGFLSKDPNSESDSESGSESNNSPRKIRSITIDYKTPKATYSNHINNKTCNKYGTHVTIRKKLK
jgi:hypothetical protein